MSTNIHNQSSLSKFGELLFARQTPQVSAERHKGLFETFRAWRARRAAESELSNMSDRALADIGVNRDNIKEAVRVRRAIR
jgi:uncharacterized protein YjiS (DUF1127 family)